MNYAVLQLTQEGDRKLKTIYVENKEDAINKFKELVTLNLYDEEYEIKEKIVDVAQKEEKFFKWLWERRSHSCFIWILEVKNNICDIVLDDEFLETFNEINIDSDTDDNKED
jgi:hypothetical protein